MRAQMFALIMLIAGSGLLAHADDPDLEYKPYATAEGRYKVLFPGPVRTERTEVKTATGPRKLTLDTVQVTDEVVFMVTFVDVPDDVAKAPIGPRLDKVRDGNVGSNGKLLSETNVEVGIEKLPARDLLIEKPATFVRIRIVAAGNRLYQVMIQGPKEFVTSKESDRFYESFEVTK